ncbi:hypothetical protein ACHAWT_008962, partial [Skeletonema menzelii]
CIFVASLQSFVLLSKITSVDNDVNTDSNKILKSLSSQPNNNAATAIRTQQKKHSLYCHITQRQRMEKIRHFLCNGWNESDRLIQVEESHMHDPDVIWVTSEFKDIAPLVNASMQLRLERHGKRFTDNLSQHELDDIDPGWKIFIYDISDNGIGNGWLWNVNNTISPMVGCKRINFLTRTAQKGRHMMKWVNELKSGKNPSISMSLAKPVNFTNIFEEEKLNPACASVQRLSFHVREDIKRAIDDYMEKKHNYNSSIAHGSSQDDSDLSYTIAHLSRPIDVRTFWNEEACNTRCSLRNFVSDSVSQMAVKHPEIKINTDIAGYIRGRGRRRVHRAYIRGMLGTKIIVLAQRDKWEDHLRLDEALLSGALVLHDPQTYWPHKMIDGINFVVYHNITDLESKMLYYLNPINDKERMAIGQRGRELALNHHRLWHQAERVLLNDMSYHNEYGLYNKPWMNGEYLPSFYQ